MATINCADCGAERHTRWRNTKYCRPCRILKNLQYLLNWTTKCWVCDAEFAPLSREDRFCPRCDPRPATQEHCALCDRDDQKLIDREIACCRECAADPKNRKLLLRVLTKKVQARVAAAGS